MPPINSKTASFGRHTVFSRGLVSPRFFPMIPLGILVVLGYGGTDAYEPELNADSAQVAAESNTSPRSVLKSAVRVMEVQPGETSLAITVTRTVKPQQENRVDVTVRSGQILVDTKVALKPRIIGFDVELNDVNIPAWRFPPTGLRLRNLSASLLDAETRSATSIGETQQSFAGKGELLLNWAMLDEENELIHLRPVVLQDLDFGGEISTREDEHARLKLQASGEGLLWNWVNALEFKDLVFNSESVETSEH